MRKRSSVRNPFMLAMLVFLALTGAGCMSLSTNVPILSDQSHLGTPYSGARVDLHVLTCFSKNLLRDPAVLILTPIVLLHLVDLPLSATVDTLLLPFDIASEREARPVVPDGGSCKLIGM